MTMRIEILQPLLNLLILVFCLDMALSGAIAIVHRKAVTEKPRLLGLAIMRWMRASADKMNKRNALIDFLFDQRVMAIYFLISGVLVADAALSTLIQMLR